MWSIPFALFLCAAFEPAANSIPTAGSGKAVAPVVALASTLSQDLQASLLDSTNVLRSFVAQGVIKELPADGSGVVVAHEEIRGFMPKMTMEFEVRDTNELRNLLPGDTVSFRVRANDKSSWIEGIQRTSRIASTGSDNGEPTSRSLLQIARLKPGDPLPDAPLIAENGQTVRLSAFRGQALAFTFLFTRCPLPDFCPRMNLNFNRARQLLLKSPSAPTNWQFLSISFDPEFDRPEVLARYAFGYRGPDTERWLFAAAPASVLNSMASLLDFHFGKDGGGFAHNLRTFVLDTNGRLYRAFDGNKWTPEQLAEALAKAAQVKGEGP